MLKHLARTLMITMTILLMVFGAQSLSRQVPDGTVRRSSALQQNPQQVGEWGQVLNWGIQAKHMVLLPTGNVLVWSTGDNARVWQPATNTFTQVPAFFGDLHCAGQVTLADGRVLVVGGELGASLVGIKVTALFDPFTNTWTEGTPMTYARWYPTATTLPDGRVLAVSGTDENGTRMTVPEVYDPVANSWTQLTGANRTQGLYPFMYVVPNGKVYAAGTSNTTAILDTSGSGSWTPGPTNSFGSNQYSESGAMYLPGKILRTGGGDPAMAHTAKIDMTAATPAWTQLSSMAFPRRRHNMTILADGTVMAVGGTRQADEEALAVLEGEIWDPATENWRTVAAMTDARMYHSTVLLLADGRVLTAGGESSGRLRAQIYSPPYLFKGPRPVVASAPPAAAYGSTFSVSSPDAADVGSVALIRPAGVTHAIDMNQRYVPLTFTTQGSSLSVQAPANSNIAPPGFYMLILKNAAGVPSVARWVRIGSATSLTPGSISGTVRDNQTGAGIPNATVSFSGGSSITDALGNYTLDNVPSGEHLVTAVASGYAPSTQAQMVAPGGAHPLNFSLDEPGTVRGTVFDEATAAALSGATITYDGGTAVTSAMGTFTIANLPIGRHTLTASATGYERVEQIVDVVAGNATNVTFTLPSKPTYIAGVVFNRQTNAPIVGASVSYNGGTATTDDLGRYRLDNTPPGTHTIIASAPGYRTLSQEGVVTRGAYAVLDFALTVERNLLVNGGFEADANGDGRPDGWSSSSKFTRSAAVTYSGSAAGKHTPTDNTDYAIYQTVGGVVPSVPYSFDSWVNIPPTSGPFTYKVQVLWYNASNALLRGDTIKTYSAATNGWTQATAGLIAPPGTATAQVRLRVGTNANATIYIDDVALQPTTNLLVNGGFEADANGDGRPDGWSSSSKFTRSAAVTYSGSAAGRHFTTTNASYTISQNVVPVVPGVAYGFAGRVLIPSTSDTFSLKLQVQWFSADGTLLRTNTVKTYTAATTGWDAAAAGLVAPANAAYAQVRMVVSSLNATIYVDDLALGP